MNNSKNNPMKDIKQELKEKALKIKTLKEGRKPSNFIHEIHSDLWKLDYIRNDYRHLHIAYCELRGTPRDKIENPRDNNKPCESIIESIKQKWMVKLEEWKALHTDS